MINTNDFDKGYKDGLKQAREGKKKNFSDFSKLRAFFSSHALDTYIDGINRGYTDGLREKHLVHQTVPLITDEQRQQIKQQHSSQTRTTGRQNIAAQTHRGNTMNPIIENIETNDIPYIERIIGHLEDTPI